MGGDLMRVTIKDVAKAANVSPATVSLVMNNRPVPVAPATRERVLNAAKELRYRPNHMAVALTTRKTNTIGLIIPDITNPVSYTHLDVYKRQASCCCGRCGCCPWTCCGNVRQSIGSQEPLYSVVRLHTGEAPAEPGTHHDSSLCHFILLSFPVFCP